MFVSMDRLSDIKDSNINAKPSLIHETMHPSQRQDDPFNLGDMVTFYDNDRPINGVVRWIGRNMEILKDGSEIVGIETVSFYYMFTSCTCRAVRLLF